MKLSGGWLLLIGCCGISFALSGSIGTGQEMMPSRESVVTSDTSEWGRDTVLPCADTVLAVGENRGDTLKPLQTFSYANVRDYIFAALSYPAAAIEKEIEGNVYVHFRIDTLGRIGEINVVKQAHPLLDSAALRLIRGMPRWRPVSRFGRPVSVEYTVPVIFKLKDP